MGGGNVKKAGWWMVAAWALWGAGGGAGAQEAPQAEAKASPQKIGFINLETIEAGWIEYQVLKRDMEKFFQVDRRDIQKLLEDIDQRQEMLEERKQRGSISERDYNNFREHLAFQRRKVTIYTEIRALIVQDKVDQQLAKANQIVEETVQRIGEEEGYDLILQSGNLIGGRAELDLSQKVINVLNASDTGLTGLSRF